jgi:hypothetical protein
MQYDSDTLAYLLRKRKHNCELGRELKRPHIEATDAEVELGSRSLECSRPLELRLGTDQDERHSERLEAGRDGRPLIAVVTPPIPP